MKERKVRKNKFTYRKRSLYWLYRRVYKACTGLNPNIYIHNFHHTHIEDNVRIASGVAIISSNHNAYDVSKQDPHEDIYIGHDSLIGANAVILPGITLGPHTIVGAGAVVTTSFPEGYCVIVGNPARKVKELEKKRCRSINTCR